MGFERFSSSKWPALVRHERSKSFPSSSGPVQSIMGLTSEVDHEQNSITGHSDGRANGKKAHTSNAEIQNALRQEIQHLEKRLHNQISARGAMEKALGYGASSCDVYNKNTISKPATELIKDIAILELEVGYMEQYLLSLYREAFDQQLPHSSPSKKDDGKKSPLTIPSRKRLDFSRSDVTSSRVKFSPGTEILALSNSRKEAKDQSDEKLVVDLGVQRSHSLLHEFAPLGDKTSPPAETFGKALCACRSQPLSMMEYAQNNASNIISLAEHLGTRLSNHFPETPNKLSEEMVKCMSTIYCKLSDPPSADHGLSTPTSSLSSVGAFSPKEQCGLWSPGLRNDSSFDVRLDNPFHVEGLKDFSGPYSTMVEVNCLYRDGQNLGDTEHLIQTFRNLISRLEYIDPRKMSHEEKLSFWINVHNALVMHAFLAYGVPQNNSKRMYLLLKAAYNIGGQIVSAYVIQNTILGCRISRPGQWLRLLFSSRTKFKAGDKRQGFAIERPEPLLHFALSSGNHSDPAVRIYTPKRVSQELEAAKEEYIRATLGVRKDHKIILPKIVESFAKDSGLLAAEIMEMIQRSLTPNLRKSIKKLQQGKSREIIKWAPHNFSFRYIIPKDLAK